LLGITFGCRSRRTLSLHLIAKVTPEVLFSDLQDFLHRARGERLLIAQRDLHQRGPTLK
jgi:hypothetical protein